MSRLFPLQALTRSAWYGAWALTMDILMAASSRKTRALHTQYTSLCTMVTWSTKIAHGEHQGARQTSPCVTREVVKTVMCSRQTGLNDSTKPSQCEGYRSEPGECVGLCFCQMVILCSFLVEDNCFVFEISWLVKMFIEVQMLFNPSA